MKIFSGLLVGCAESTQHAIILWGWLLNVNRVLQAPVALAVLLQHPIHVRSV
jgi:hypothetical protein